jgi:3-oxoacyl-ACP reductase-like protein
VSTPSTSSTAFTSSTTSAPSPAPSGSPPPATATATAAAATTTAPPASAASTAGHTPVVANDGTKVSLVCDNCDSKAAEIYCEDCKQNLCGSNGDDCDAGTHKAAKFQSHRRTPIK